MAAGGCPAAVCLLASGGQRAGCRESGPVPSGLRRPSCCAICSAANESMPPSWTATACRAGVKEVQAGLLRVNIKKTSDPNSLPRGLQDIPTDRISTVQFTRYEGNKRALFGTGFLWAA